MKKLFISQPMRGKTDEEILAERKKAIESAERNLGEPVEVKTSVLSSTALRLSRITQRSREEVILLSPSHGLNDRLIQAFCLV